MVNGAGVGDCIIRATRVIRQNDWCCGGGEYLQLLLGIGGGGGVLVHGQGGDAGGAGNTDSNKCNQRTQQLAQEQDRGQLAECSPQLAKAA